MDKSKFYFFVLFFWNIGSAWAVVSQEGLPSLTVGTIGVETGLSADIWGANPKADDVIRQIQACADVDFNDSEREILKQILMTDVGGNKELEKKSEEYLKARLETLIKQGLFKEVRTLLDQVPKKTDELKKLQAEALFADGFVSAACEENLISAFEKEEGFIRAVCADTIGVPPASALAYEVYREGGHDTHPFLNAAGEVLYRNLSPELPEGVPSVWEAPMVAKAYGMKVFDRALSRETLLALFGNETVPPEVRLKAEKVLRKEVKKEPADGLILDYLRAMAEMRMKLQTILPQNAMAEKKHVESD